LKLVDQTDAREIGRGAELVCDVRRSFIGDVDVAGDAAVSSMRDRSNKMMLSS
jgi:hypothetical protein